MEFRSFAAHAADVEATDADLDVVAKVAALFAEAGDDLAVVARFVQGRVFPAHSETKLDVGPRLCYEALARAAATNVSVDDVEARLAETGDIGEVAANLDLGGQAGLGAFAAEGGDDGLSVADVYADLRALAAAEGDGSQDEKVTLLFGLFNDCSGEEARYLARLVLGEMRIGVGEGAVRDAIAEAFDVAVESTERALQVSNDYGLVAETARDDGEEGLDAMHLEVGRPVQAMLAQAGTVTDALEEWEEAAVETKFDGARVQVHWDGEEVSLYSRNMEDVTDALPELVEFVEEHVEAPVILDGEAVAVDDDGSPLPFQEILKRFRRKHDVAEMRDEIRVELHAFDCLHAGGEDLLDEPFRERHERLRAVVDDESAVSEILVTEDADEIAAFEEDALEAGHEGIMLKDPYAAYTPGDRGKHWLKRKPDVETLDLVVTGAEWGEGRRASFLGTFLLSARDEATGEFETIGKVATGITDEELADLTALLEPHVRAEDGQEVDLEPAVVFEVGYEEIQTSPTYESGYALRFPRFVTVREDKPPEDADTIERVERLADRQG
ncbi:ATP-dependent DNA ligase LigA [Halobacterium sp. CBA1126]|uniref:ATP-dependent DNA ligase LigA n=1 Tax=Halobacterium sp. CBA1126 TaxID=2668074 RepID=UPI0012FBE5F6|nr:ATP-dependent DNA ligase LigA [Halobacterium sp. CBA1126]MUV60946.1 ATP-dependent DNA ligase [Halobacterium sp. CBA1126]